MSLRSPVGEAAAEALGRVRPDLLAVVPREMSKRQKQALAVWERPGDSQTPAAVAAELGVGVSGARQLLHLAGAIRTRPGHSRRCAVVRLKAGLSAEAVQKELGLNHVSLEFAINDYAYELLVNQGGDLPSSQRIGYASSRRRR
ncbi:MAG: hypothetical protein GY719_30265 [bacterium]|nr:hypothetical protein [bacterium]